jgi:hypothetical protein
MTTDSFFATAIAGLLVLFLGSVLAFAGYRFFLGLLPVFGFIFGLGFGAQMIQAFFGQGFLATATSWVVGLLFAVAFAALSYLFYLFAVALVAFALGYALGVGVLEAIGLDFGTLVALVGVAVGVAVAFGALALNLQKYVVIAATALWGAGLVVGTLLFLVGGLPPAETAANPVRAALQGSPLWLLLFLAVAAAGAAVQYRTTLGREVESFNRLTGWSDAGAVAPVPPPAP